MSCYHPLKAFRTPTGVVFSELHRHDIIGDIELPCGMCIGCRMRRATDWELRCMHEASLHDANCFVTLTYGRDKMPANGSLDYKDFQLFMKRLRMAKLREYGLGCGPIRFYMCGEYGELNQRPHYHACLFGVDFRSDRVPAGKSGSGHLFYNSKELSDLWSHGIVSVQDLTRETAGYCARYIMKKQLGAVHGAPFPGCPVRSEEAYRYVNPETGEIFDKVPEFARMSLKPGIGADWYKQYGSHVSRQDFVIGDGVKKNPPKYYDKLFRRSGDVEKDRVEFERLMGARLHLEDQTPERLGVSEKVHLARVSKLARSNVL